MIDGTPRRNPPGASTAAVAVVLAAFLAASSRPYAMEASGLSPGPEAAQTRHENPLGVFDGHSDLGPVDLPGSASYDPQKQEYLIEGAGLNMWFASDEGHFLWKRLKGDFILSARVEFIGQGGAAHRKIGCMARASLDPDSAHVSAVVHGDGLTSVQYRKTRGEQTLEDEIGVTGPNQIQLERRGRVCIMSVAHFGETYIREQVDGVALGDEIYVGLFICAHKADTLERAQFTNVRIVIPPKDGVIRSRDHIRSRLEILDVAAKNRMVVDESPKLRQAPNWTRDGRALIYNSGGLLYRLDLATGTSAVIDSGFATSINGNHVLSFNGKLLGISHVIPDHGGTSIIYTLPIEGGQPRRVTPRGPSDLHGWSPDGRTLVYGGERKGQIDVYKINVRGVKETRLTKAKGRNDGPEFTPDGRFIYFNSNRKDGMRIWRMSQDGKRQRQTTSDSLQDWFPHVSPDGRWLVFLSYEKDIPSGDDPPDRQVYIRMMPTAGGEVRVIAYIFGGRGSIDAPSWSPDSKRIAFFSYSDEIR